MIMKKRHDKYKKFAWHNSCKFSSELTPKTYNYGKHCKTRTQVPNIQKLN